MISMLAYDFFPWASCWCYHYVRAVRDTCYRASSCILLSCSMPIHQQSAVKFSFSEGVVLTSSELLLPYVDISDLT